MDYLYLDNFRGFNKTLIPIKDVNFFTGENSSGKSSVLSLYALITDYKFFVKPSFKEGNIYIGSFNEIVSDPEQKMFTVGRYFTNENEFNGCYLFTFKSKFGEPELCRFSFSTSSDPYELITVLYEEDSLAYSSEFLTFKNKENLEEILTKTKLLHETKSKTVERLKIPSENRHKIMPPAILMVLLSKLVGKDDDSLKSITFESSDLFKFNSVSTSSDIKWFAPIREVPKRVYSDHSLNYSPTGEHTPYILKELFNKGNKKIIDSIQQYGSLSGLFSEISIKELGDVPDSPIELLIKIESGKFNISNVGYGVSQILPIIVEILREEGACFCIQQPEVHLHPKAQAAFGELIHNSSLQKKHKFLIETHSDFIIDRFRLKVRGTKKSQKNKALSSQVLYFTKSLDGNFVQSIEINSDGSYSDTQPDDFREFFLNESMELLNI